MINHFTSQSQTCQLKKIKHWKEIVNVVQFQVELMGINLKQNLKLPFSDSSSTNNHLQYLSVYDGNVNNFSQYVTEDKLM